MNKRAFTIVALLFLGFSIIKPSLSSTSPPIIRSSGLVDYTRPPTLNGNGRLHVSGNKIVDEYGQKVFLKGVNYQFVCWYWRAHGCPMNEEQYEYMADWGCNVVRLANQFAYFSEDVLDKLEQQVEWASQNRIYSVLATNYGAGSTYIDDWSEADWRNWIDIWKAIATRFAGNPNVLYKIQGEPKGISSSVYQTRMRQCIDAIRTIDPLVIIVVDALSTNDWYDVGLNFERPYDPEIFGSGYPIQRDNLVFDFSFYYGDDSPWYDEDAIRYSYDVYGARWCLSNNRAVWLAEFNYVVETSPLYGETWFRHAMKVCDTDGFSGYAAWAWTCEGTDNFNLLLDWYGTPSATGQVLQDYL